MPGSTDSPAPPRKRRRRRIALAILTVLLIVAIAHALMPGRTPAADPNLEPSRHDVVAVFGASGTAGDGVLKALLDDPGVTQIHVVTRRSTPRIDAGVASGKIHMIKHMNYLDYGALEVILPEVHAVYWALGTSAANVDKETYSEIHVDFPVAFVRQWLGSDGEGERSFHLISGQGASADSWQHWAREKARAERDLAALVEGTNLRVVSYRPTYIAPTEEQSHLGHSIVHTLFAPLDLATRATKIGRAMLEVTARGAGELPSGTILENKDLLEYAAAYTARQ